MWMFMVPVRTTYVLPLAPVKPLDNAAFALCAGFRISLCCTPMEVINLSWIGMKDSSGPAKALWWTLALYGSAGITFAPQDEAYVWRVIDALALAVLLYIIALLEYLDAVLKRAVQSGACFLQGILAVGRLLLSVALLSKLDNS